MLIAKYIDAKGKESFAEVRKVGRVLFDPRDGWILLSLPLDIPGRKREVEWIHPADTRIEWIRPFRFASGAFDSATLAGGVSVRD